MWRWPETASGHADDIALLSRAVHEAGGGTNGMFQGSSLLQAFTPLSSGVQCLSYCTSRNLVLVGSQSGAVQCYSIGARGALHYRYAIEAHGSPILSFSLRPHPARAAALAAAAAAEKALVDAAAVANAASQDRRCGPPVSTDRRPAGC